ncbi:MAG: peptide-methionine (R)-S-oxide reductase [Chitinophagales bacterium]|jgi:peptide-methionine (R)-S-oxide reductase
MTKLAVSQEDKFKKKLSKAQYKVWRDKATEASFSGNYNLHFEAGKYCCLACGSALFNSADKYDAG